MMHNIFSGNAKIALMRSKVFLRVGVLGLVASFQISIMSNPAHAIKLYSKNNGNIACSTCHSRTGLSNGTMYPLTSKGDYFKTNGTLLPRAAPVPTAPPYNPPAPPYQPPYTPPQPPVYPPNVAPLPTVNLAYPLQSELKRLGCLPGRVDGVWGHGSRAALIRFSNLARLRLGSEPSQNALNVARRTPSGYCPPVRPVYPTQPPVYPTQPPIYPTRPPVYPPNVAPLPTASLAYPLQSELKRLGCLPGRVDGVWGQGSRAALLRFSNLARLRLGSEPSQNALNVARRTPSGYCPPVRPVYPTQTPVYPTQTPIYPIPTPVYPPRVNNPPHNDPPPPTQASPQQCVKRCEVIGQQCHSKLTKLGNSKGWDGDLRKSYYDDNCAPKVNACKFSCNPKGPIGRGECRYERDGSQICS